jgi:hypothetical protein
VSVCYREDGKMQLATAITPRQQAKRQHSLQFSVVCSR